MALFGAHESAAGGLHLAFDRIAQVGGESLQIFTRNQRQWQPKPLSARAGKISLSLMMVLAKAAGKGEDAGFILVISLVKGT